MPCRSRTLVLLLAVVIPLSCSDSDDDASVTTSAPPTTVVAEPTIPEEERAADPRVIAENSHLPDEGAFAFGQELRITDTGPEPATLVVIVDEELVVLNDSSAAVNLRFLNGTVGAAELTETGEIPPGGSFAVTPIRAVSVTYEVAGKPEQAGHIQVDMGSFVG